MSVVIVRTERHIEELAPRLLGERATTMSNAVRRAIRTANPHVDLERLQPGDVLTIPDHDDVRVRHDAAPEDLAAEGLAAMVDGLREVVAALADQADTEAKVEAADRAVVRRSLGLRAVEQAAEQDRHLRGERDRVVAALAEADDTAQEAAATRKRAVATWRQHLDVLGEGR
jgi:hypothetical protein